MSTTTKSRSESRIELGPQSSLEELLGGLEQVQLGPQDTQKIAELQRKIDNLNSGGSENVTFASGTDSAAIARNRANNQSKIADLQQQIEDIKSAAPKKRSGGMIQEGIEKLAKMGAEGVDMTSYNLGKDASNDLAAMLKTFTETGGLPGQADISQANDLASNLFAARRTALDQSIQDQTTAFQREAGRRGTMANDPVFAAKLRTGFMRQQDLLSAEQQAQGTQIAMGLPGQRLGYAGQRADVLNTVADRDSQRYQQGLSNLAALLGIGQSQLGMEQGWRLNTGTQKTENTQTSSGFGPTMSGIGAAVGAAGTLMGGYGAITQGTAFSRLMQNPVIGGNTTMNQIGTPNYSLGNFNLRY